MENENEVTDTLSKEEKKVIDYVRKLSHGEIKIIVQDGKPTRIEEIKRSIKL